MQTEKNKSHKSRQMGSAFHINGYKKNKVTDICNLLQSGN